MFDCIYYHHILFLQAINNLIFDELKLTAQRDALGMVEWFSMTSRENVPLSLFVEPIWSTRVHLVGHIRHYGSKKNNLGALLFN